MREENAVSSAWGRCPACGYNNVPDEDRCEKCGRKFQGPQRLAGRPPNLARNRSKEIGDGVERKIHAVRIHLPETPTSPERLPESTRKQLSKRVEAFRSRRINLNLPLQFEDEPLQKQEAPGPKAATPRVEPIAKPAQAPAVPRLPRHTPPRIQQPELDFPFPEAEVESLLVLPVAPFALRLLGHAGDFALTVAAFLLFLSPLKLVEGPVAFSRFLLAGMGCAYLLLVLLYGVIFLCVAGATPTMKWLGLRLVNFDGAPPPRHQRFCRFLGAIASVGSFFLGFLWAAVDEEKLSWHDRISKTFLTMSERRPSYRGF